MKGNFVDVRATEAAMEQSRMVERMLGLHAAAAVDGSWTGVVEGEEGGSHGVGAARQVRREPRDRGGIAQRGITRR